MRLLSVRWVTSVALAASVMTGARHACADDESSTDRAPMALRQPLIVGVTTDTFPYGYKGDDGQWTGFSVDLLDAVVAEMGLQIRRVAAPGKDLQARFRAGEFDLMQALSQTPEREVYADFSVPYLTLQGNLFVPKRGNRITRLEDLNGRKFAIIGVGSIGERFLAEQNIRVDPVYVSSSEDALMLVDKGECAATFAAQLTALAVIERAGLSNITTFGRPFADYDIRHCYAVHEGDTLLLARLNEGLAILQRKGIYDEIYRKWFGRFGGAMFTRQQVIGYGMVLLAVALVAALLALQRQRRLRRRLARQSEEMVRQQAILQALYDNIPMAMCVLENAAEGRRVLSINRQAEPLFRLTASAAAGRYLRDLPADPEWFQLLADILGKHRSERGLAREERLLAGSRRRVVATVVPLAPGPDGRERACVLAEDVTSARALDEEVAQSRRLRAVGEVVGGIAHEFNNLLTPVMLKVAEIRMDRAGDERLREELLPIADAARRAADLTRRLLAFGRKGDAAIEEVKVAPVVEGCLSLLRSAIDRRIALKNRVPPGLPPVRISSTDLNQVILNLILNARDTLLDRLARGDEGYVPEICLDGVFLPPDADRSGAEPGAEGWVRVTVADNGMGMAPEVRERIFEPFFTTKDVGKGSGLGLATVWHLLSQGGGRVEVESVPGAGSKFHVTLAVAPARVAPVATPEEAPSVVSGGRRVFLGDDDELVARAMAESIRRAGHEVQRLGEGRAIWDHLREHAADYDLIILDVNMPGMSGSEIAQRLRAEGRFRGPIVIVSGRLSAADRAALFASSVDAILEKPFEPDEMLRTIEQALRRGARA
ncbi:MAG: transporter substrate-binding domain-containing protein [Opitutaceae bacterium]|nr:transporter substrate-binding domain-containing protein [Opitutaceae bacterium]